MADTRPLRPRLAASVLTIDRHDDNAARILMGKRSDGHIFMPGYHVFPGGGVERADYNGPAVLDDHQHSAVMRGLPSRAGANTAHAIARAALREMAEETGFAASDGTIPALYYLGRAITPPGQVRRYDTRFFIADSQDFLAASNLPDNELLQTGWVDLEQLDGLKIHRITAFMIGQARQYLAGERSALRPCAHTRYGKHYVRHE